VPGDRLPHLPAGVARQPVGQADAAVVTAKGQAQANIETATGQAQANKLVNDSLTDRVLQYQYIQKIVDKVQVMLIPGGQQFLLDLKSVLGQSAPTPTPTASPKP
jgi:regulator of protease activity HflC (stomatin/prohibitin superfamily)